MNVFNKVTLESLKKNRTRTIVTIIGIMLSAASAIILIVFGLDLIKDQRRNAARLSYVLIAFTVVELLVDVMLQGIGPFLLRPAVQLVILIALSATVDPTLRQERELQRRLQEMLDRDAAEGAAQAQAPRAAGLPSAGVAFDRAGVAHIRVVGVAAEFTARAALAQQVPALVELDFDIAQALAARVGIGGGIAQALLLGHEVVDVLQDVLVVHARASYRSEWIRLRAGRPRAAPAAG